MKRSDLQVTGVVEVGMMVRVSLDKGRVLIDVNFSAYKAADEFYDALHNNELPQVTIIDKRNE